MAAFPQRPLPAMNAVVGVLIAQNPETDAVRRWQITGADVLWLGRMLCAEDGFRGTNETEARAYERGRAMVSMILRRLGVHFFSGPYTSVEHLLRGNPSGGNPKGWSSPIRHSQGIESNSRATARPWAEVPGYYQAAVLDTVTGRVPFIAAHVVDAAEGSTCPLSPLPDNANTDLRCFTEVRIAQNAPDWRREFPGLTRSWLISTSRSRRWPEENIYIEGGARARTPGRMRGPIVFTLALLAAGGGYWWWTRRR